MLQESEKKDVIDWLDQKSTEISTDIIALTSQNIRVCAWDPFCKSYAKDCGGWNPNGCRNYKIFAKGLPKNYEEVIEKRGKERTQEQ